MRNTIYLVALLAAFAPSFAHAQDTTAVASGVTLHAGDAVKISVWRKPEMSGEFAISADGSVSDPFYGAVKVAEIPFATAEARLRQYVARYETTPWVFVEPLFRVTVGGEVRSPNVYTLRREATIAQAVAQAGGVTASGRPERVRLAREGQVFMIDLTDPNSPLAHSPIRSRDEIMVGRQRSLFREYVAPSASIVAAVATIIRLFIK